MTNTAPGGINQVDNFWGEYNATDDSGYGLSIGIASLAFSEVIQAFASTGTKLECTVLKMEQVVSKIENEPVNLTTEAMDVETAAAHVGLAALFALL